MGCHCHQLINWQQNQQKNGNKKKKTQPETWVMTWKEWAAVVEVDVGGSSRLLWIATIIVVVTVAGKEISRRNKKK